MNRYCTKARRVLNHSRGVSRLLLLLILMAMTGLVLPGRISRLDSSSPSPASPTNTAMPALKGDEAIEQLKQQGTYGSLQEAIAAVGYQATWQTSPKLDGIGAGFEFKNQPNNLLAYVTADGLHATALAGGKQSWRLDLKLQDYGYGQARSIVRAGELTAKANRVEIKRSAALTEWFVNTSRGIEQGFTLASPPHSAIGNSQSAVGKEPLRMRFSVSGSLRASLDEAHDGVAFSREADSVLVSYDKLFVMDAKGRGLAARMKLSAGELIIEVEDAGAEYPLTIDPLLRELTKLAVSDAAAFDSLGWSVAIDGDTVVVSSLVHDAAYVFVRGGTSWTEQAKLTASDVTAGDFGISVAVSGDTVVVGAFSDDVGANVDQGSAYVFGRSGVSWSQQAKLTASDGAAGDFFGYSVAVSSDTVIVGAIDDDVAGKLDQGSAYVFARSGVSWIQHAKLTASDGSAGDGFGISVAISGDTAIVGAEADDVGVNNGQGSAYVFTRNGLSWPQQAKLTASDGAIGDGFGVSVAISGDTAIVGAGLDDALISDQGSAYAYVRNGTSWTEQARLTASDGTTGDRFGISVAISGDNVIVGAWSDDAPFLDQGSAYAFVRIGGAWTQQQRFTASDGAANDSFGYSVGISGDTVVVGAWGDTVGAHTRQGSAYLFVGDWSQQAQPTQTGGLAGDTFGRSVSISGDTAVIGAPLDDVAGNADQGSAAVFVHSSGTWSQQQLLTADDGEPDDRFGVSVAINADSIVVGTANDDVGGNTDQGSAYVFVRNGVTWTQQQQLTASDGAAQDQFGNSVSINGETVVVGAVGDESSRGSAYVFARIGATWSEQQQLLASDGAENDEFGNSVAISGDIIVIGASGDDVVSADQGSAYVFVRTGVSWFEQQQLVAGDAAESDTFGSSVASTVTLLSSERRVMMSSRAPIKVPPMFFADWRELDGAGESHGFRGATGEAFGASVAVNGDTVVVGAPHVRSLFPNRGAAYLFGRGGSRWFLRKELPQLGFFTDNFGSSVTVSGNTVVVGAPLRDVSGRVDQGYRHMSFLLGSTPPPRSSQAAPRDRRAARPRSQQSPTSSTAKTRSAISQSLSHPLPQAF